MSKLKSWKITLIDGEVLFSPDYDQLKRDEDYCAFRKDLTIDNEKIKNMSEKEYDKLKESDLWETQLVLPIHSIKKMEFVNFPFIVEE